MLLDILVLSFIIALIRGGRPAPFDVKRPSLVILAVALQVAAIFVPHLVSQSFILLSYVALAAGLISNSERTSMRLILVGVLLNVIVIAANYGRMPVSLSAAAHVGVNIAPLVSNTDFKRVAMSDDTRFNFLGDVIFVPYPLRRVVSLGDIVIAVGAFTLVQEFMSRPITFRVRRLSL